MVDWNNKEEVREYKREYYLNNKDKIKKHRRKYEESKKCKEMRAKARKKPKNIKRHNEYSKQYLNNNPEEYKKHKIRMLAANSIKIPENTLCEICKKELATERHHEDYNKPLGVMFLCIKCHKMKHKKDKQVIGNES